MLHRTILTLFFVVLSSLVSSAGEPLHVVMLGDSNTWIGGEACDQPRGWNKWFKDLFQPTTCRSYARSGATWTNTPSTHRDTEEDIELLGDNNVIYNQVCRLEETINSGTQAKPQLILIMAGTNDAWFRKARPNAFAKTAEDVFATDRDALLSQPINQIVTLAEAVRFNCELLKSFCPDARIILLTPMPSVAAGAVAITKAGDLIEDCGRLSGLSVLRMDKHSGIDVAQERREHRYTTDGTHTSEAGAQQVGTYVAQQVRMLLQPLTP